MIHGKECKPDALWLDNAYRIHSKRVSTVRSGRIIASARGKARTHPWVVAMEVWTIHVWYPSYLISVQGERPGVSETFNNCCEEK